MHTHVPAKLVRDKSSLPWVTQDIKHLIRKRDRLCTSYKGIVDLEKKKAFQTLRQHIKRKIKDAYQIYLEGLLGLNDGESKCDNKKLFSFFKNSQQDRQGSTSLKHN